MSRFLQRVIAAAQNPGGSIHPVLGSVYQPTLRPGLQEDAPAASASPEHWPAATPTARPGGRRTDRRSSGIDSADRDHPEGAAESRVAFDPRHETDEPERDAAENLGRGAASGPPPSRAPLVDPIRASRGRRKPVSPGKAAPSRGEAVSRAATDSASSLRNPVSDRGDDAARTAIGTSADGDTLVADRHASGAGHYSLLMPGILAGTAPGGIAPVVSSLRSRMPDPGEAHDDSHRSRAAAREADEISIHIGRIEVTAAAPAPARAAAAPPRRSPSLDEFLKRRPGRAG